LRIKIIASAIRCLGAGEWRIQSGEGAPSGRMTGSQRCAYYKIKIVCVKQKVTAAAATAATAATKRRMWIQVLALCTGRGASAAPALSATAVAMAVVSALAVAVAHSKKCCPRCHCEQHLKPTTNLF